MQGQRLLMFVCLFVCFQNVAFGLSILFCSEPQMQESKWGAASGRRWAEPRKRRIPLPPTLPWSSLVTWPHFLAANTEVQSCCDSRTKRKRVSSSAPQFATAAGMGGRGRRLGAPRGDSGSHRSMFERAFLYFSYFFFLN